MTVYVVVEETNGASNGEPDACVVAVFASEALAKADVATREDAARAQGAVMAGDPDGDDYWTLSYSVEAHEVQGLAVPS